MRSGAGEAHADRAPPHAGAPGAVAFIGQGSTTARGNLSLPARGRGLSGSAPMGMGAWISRAGAQSLFARPLLHREENSLRGAARVCLLVASRTRPVRSRAPVAGNVRSM